MGSDGSDIRRNGRARGRERRAGLASLGRAAGCEALSLHLIFLFCFSFLLHCLNSNLVWNFECKIGVPYSLEF